MHIKFWSEIRKGRDYSEDPDVNGRIVLEWILRIYGGKLRTGSYGLGQEPVAGSCEHGNEPSGSIKPGEFLD